MSKVTVTIVWEFEAEEIFTPEAIEDLSMENPDAAQAKTEFWEEAIWNFLPKSQDFYLEVAGE